jgi:hypothetical protein
MVRIAWVLGGVLLLGCGEGIRRERIPKQVEKDTVAFDQPRKIGILVKEAERDVPPDQCEEGASKACWEGRHIAPGGDSRRFRIRCHQDEDGVKRWDRSACDTPLVVSFDEEEKVEFTRPALSDTEWVSAKTPWLAIDLDGDGCIDRLSELFGPPDDKSLGRTGFDKLKMFDANHDGRIDELDPAYGSLLLWFDRDQNKTCSPSEITKLKDAGIKSIDLHYTSLKSNPIASYEGEVASMTRTDGKRGRVIDVYLMPTNAAGD